MLHARGHRALHFAAPCPRAKGRSRWLRCRAHNAYEAEREFGPFVLREDEVGHLAHSTGSGPDRVAVSAYSIGFPQRHLGYDRGPRTKRSNRSGMGLTSERELVERALSIYDADDGREAVFPPVARRFLEAREALGLSREDVAVCWGQPVSMYWDLEFHDDEAFTVLSVRDLVVLAGILRIPLIRLLFGAEASPALPAVPYAEVARRLHARIQDEAISADELSEQAGWEVAEYLDTPDKLPDLPICGFRSVCRVAGVDWAAALPTGA